MKNDPNPHWFLALRGLVPLLAFNWVALSKGPFGRLLRRREAIRNTSYCPDDIHLAKLSTLFTSRLPPSSDRDENKEWMDGWPTRQDKYSNIQEAVAPPILMQMFSETTQKRTEESSLMACRQALDHLRSVFCLPWSTSRYWRDSKAGVYIWPGVVPQLYIELLMDHNPEALILFAHYCVLIKRVDSCWHFKGLGVALFEAVERELDDEWLPWIQWAKDQPTA